MTPEIPEIPEIPETLSPPPPRKRRVWLRALLLAVGLVFAVVVAGSAWLIGSTAGARFVLAGAGLKATELEGSLAGPLRAQALVFTRPKLAVILNNVSFDWKPLSLLRGQLHLTALTADTFVIATAPATERGTGPVTLKPPLAIRVDKASLKKVAFATLIEGGKFTPTVELTDFSLDSVVSGDAWRFESAGAMTAAGRLDVRGSIGSEKPFPMDIAAELSGEREGKRYRLTGTAKGELSRFEVRAQGKEGGIVGDATAAVEPFQDPPLRRLRAQLTGVDVKAFMPQAPQTLLTIDADLEGQRNRRLAGTVRVVNAQAGALDAGRLPLTQAQGQLLIAHPSYALTNAVIGFAGGGSATGDVKLEGARAEAKVVVKALNLQAIHAKLRPTQLAGGFNAQATREAQTFDVDLRDPRFGIVGKGRLAERVLTVEDARVTRGTSAARVQGKLALHGRRDFDFAGTLERADPAAFADVPAGELNGKFQAKGSLEPALAGELVLDLGESRLAGLALTGRAAVAGAEKRISSADVNLAYGGATLEAKGAYGRAGDRLAVKLSAADLAPIARAFKRDVSGGIRLEGELTGTFAAPAGRAVVAAEKLRVQGVGVATANGRLEVGAGAGSPVNALLEVTDLTRRVGTAQEPVAPKAVVTVVGTRANHRATLAAVLAPDRGSPIAALAKETRPLEVTLQGGLAERSAKPTWRGRVEKFVLAEPNGVTLTAPASLTVARDLVELGDAAIKGEWGAARFALSRWTPARIEMRGSSEGLLTRPLLRTLGLRVAPRSSMIVTAEWDVRATETLDGFVRARRVSGDMRLGDPPIPLGLEEFQIGIEASRGDVRAALTVRGKEVGKIEAKATTRIRKTADAWELPRDAPLAGEIAADIPSLKWASDWFGPDAKVEGRLNGKVAAGGTLASPTWRGRVQAENVQVRDTVQGFDIDEGQAAIALNDREVRIERFSLASAWRPSRRAERRLDDIPRPERGTMTAEGAIDFGVRSGAIVVKVQSYPVSQLPWRFIAASGESKLEVREGNLNLTGQLKADAGWFGIAQAAPPSVSDDVLIDRGEGPMSARERQKMALDLRLSLGDNLYFSGRGLATRLAGDFRLRGEPGRILQASGAIRAVGGTYDAYGQSLVIERGLLTFQGAVDNPSLNVLAVRPGLAVVAGVEILGNVARPNVRLYSMPDVPDHEKLSWLVLGRSPAEASENDAATLVAAANALLSGNRDNRRLMRNFGFDEMRLGRGESGVLGTLPQSTIAGRTGGSRGAEVFTVGKRLSKDLYVSYQQSLAEGEAALRFTYQLTRKLQLLLRAGDKPGLDAVYRWTFGD